MNKQFQKLAEELIANYPIYEELPASISGKYHLGETLRRHSENTRIIANALCDEYKVNEKDRDIILTSAMLHDIGNCELSIRGKALKNNRYTYYEETGYSRLNYLHKLHPLVGKHIILNSEIFKPYPKEQKRIANMVASHMNLWYEDTPKPSNIYEHIIAISDFIASRRSLLTELNQGIKN